MQTTKKNLGALTLGAVLLGGICLLSTTAKADVAAGEATFKTKCAACHGADGKGKEAMKTKDLASPDVQKMTDAELTEVITNGKPPKMPATKGITDPKRRLAATVVQNVMLTVKLISEMAPFRDEIRKHKLAVVGGVYDIGSGQVTFITPTP
jgi:mono/diheme cytochrome c family protein